MKGSALSASQGVCRSAASVYSAYAANYETSKAHGGWFDKQTFLSELASADAACTSAMDYRKATPTGAPKVDASSGGAVPADLVISPVKAGVGAGMPWWVWLLGGGAALYLLFGKKKKGKK
jgi:hypothetical protein